MKEFIRYETNMHYEMHKISQTILGSECCAVGRVTCDKEDLRRRPSGKPRQRGTILWRETDLSQLGIDHNWRWTTQDRKWQGVAGEDKTSHTLLSHSE